MEVRSAGTSDASQHMISNSDILWANLILVMENKYKGRISRLFRDVHLPEIQSLDIPDEYEYMDEELVELIRSGVEYQIKLPSDKQE